EKKKQKYIYGHCTQYYGKHGASYVNEEVITNQLAKVFKSIEISEDIFNKVSSALRESHEEAKKNKYNLESKIKAEIKKYEARLEKAYDDYLDGVIAEAFYKKKSEEYEENKKKLEERLNAFELIEDEYYASVSHLLKLSKNATELFINA